MVARRVRAAVIAGALLAMCSAGVFCQEAGTLVPRHLLLAMMPQKDSGFGANDALLLQRSLHQRLQEAQPDLVIIDSPPVDPGASPADLEALAGKAEADAWMTVTAGGDWGSAQLQVRAFDLLAGAPVADLRLTRTWGTVGGLSGETWADVARAVDGKFPMVENTGAEAAGENLVALTVSALPGSTLTGVGKRPVSVGPDGTVSVRLPPWHEYVVRAGLSGYQAASQRLFLSGDRQISFTQKPLSRWQVELSVADGRAPGAYVTLAVPASAAFFRFGFTTYAFGLGLDGSHVFLNDPLTNVVMQGGLYLVPEDRLFRWYAALGGFARVVHEAGEVPLLDQVAPTAAFVVAGTEVRLSEESRFFAEYTPTVFGTPLPAAFRASLGNDAPGWLFLKQQAVELLSFRLGWRWEL